jgi:glycerate-2-kinase
MDILMDKGSQGAAGERTPGGLLRAIARDAVAACDAGRAVRRAITIRPGSVIVAGRPLRMTSTARIVVLSVGKAAVPMYEAFLARLAESGTRRPVSGLVIAPKGAARPVHPEPIVPDAPAAAPTPGAAARVASGSRGGKSPARGAKKPPARLRVTTTFAVAEHPVPGSGSLRAGRAALRFMTATRPGSDVVALVSGGGSALMAAPLLPFVTAAEKSALHRILVVSGAPIGAINTVRKHLSAVKGGRLAVAARRSRSLTTLLVSDVDAGQDDDVASGPTVADRSTLDDFVALVDRYALAPSLPVRVLEALRAGRLPETPKKHHPALRRAATEVLLRNADLRQAAVRAGLTRGLAAEAMPTEVTGTADTAVETVARAIEGAPTGLRLLVLGGEVRTAPAAPGTGGRSQEFALRLAMRMRNLSVRGWAFLAAGSDGLDGSSPAAGAYVDASTLDRAQALKLDPDKALARGETWRFFHRLGDTFMTGPTGTNVRDLYMLLTGLPRHER